VTSRADRIERLSPGERWTSDSRHVLNVPGGMAQRAVDMTRALASLEVMHAAGVAAALPHVIVRAAALALARHPELHRMVCGYERLSAERVDVGLSIGGLTTDVPLVVVGVDQKPLPAVVAAVEEAIAAARSKDGRLRRYAWLTPYRFLRRWLLRSWYGALRRRRRLAGTFEVCCDSNADVLVPLRFYTDTILAAGRVKDVVVLVDGQPAIRPMACLTLCLDHVAMDGMRGAKLINAISEILEGDELLDEAREATRRRASSPLSSPSRESAA
jgi:hypothetical protein